jgi:TolA-binding protein
MAQENPIAATDSPVVEQDGLEWELFWHANRAKILGGLLAAVVVLAAVGGWAVSQSIASEDAARMLAEANDATAWEALIAKYPRSTPAADAYFRLAGAQRETGKLEESTATFRKFLSSFPNHALAGAALFGIGQNQDSAGKADEALVTYDQVITGYPKSYVAPFAAYSRAEILLRDLKRDEARKVLEAIVAEFPASSAASMAQSQVQRLAPAPAGK